MFIDMKPILSGETDKIAFDMEGELSEGAGELAQNYDIVFTDPIKVKGEVKNFSGYMTFEMTVHVRYRTKCARCLKELFREAEYHMEKNVAVKGSLQNEDIDGYIIVEGSELDLDAEIEELLMLEIPRKHLCRDDCKGICPKCGKDLNEGSCGCPEKETDPRWDVLKQLL